MIVAELEIYHSRPIAPTRRVALGDRRLPVDPPPGFGGVLLGGVVARFAADLHPDLVPDLFALSRELEAGYRIPQPRLRHRFQTDRVGLIHSRHRLLRRSGELHFSFEVDKAAPAQHVLAAVYAAGELPAGTRRTVFDVIRRGLRWTGPIGTGLIEHLSAGAGTAAALDPAAIEDPISWALEVLGFEIGESGPDRARIQRQFRSLLREAHPDLGAGDGDAARRIAALTEARRILLDADTVGS
ncbi:MAG: hypothetical protein OES57_07285 [Acidimicrobiia bacterium]|nr:hypothetical protein [Acidimicrobiia bacterium]